MNSDSTSEPLVNNLPNVGSSNVNTNSSVGSANSIDTESVSSGMGEYFSNLSWIGWTTIVLILAILGVNVFIYLAKGTELLADISKPILDFIGYFFGSTLIDATKTTVDTSATGTKAGVDIAAGTVTTGLNVLQDTSKSISGAIVNNGSTSNAEKVYNDKDDPKINQDTSLSRALNNATKEQDNTGESNAEYSADDSYSSIQGSKGSGKGGWCYIGEERNVRSCIQVGESDECMSGDIFPSQEICVNPNLRA
jgi:hypothetical protein